MISNGSRELLVQLQDSVYIAFTNAARASRRPHGVYPS